MNQEERKETLAKIRAEAKAFEAVAQALRGAEAKVALAIDLPDGEFEKRCEEVLSAVAVEMEKIGAVFDK